MISELRALLGVADSVSTQIEYWREYKGEEIVIRDYTATREENDSEIGPSSESIKQTTYVVRGTVDDVMSFPPGFRLRDVEEYIEVRDYSILSSAGLGRYDSPAIVPGGRVYVREVDEKFVSFDSIKHLESGEEADNAQHPRHDDFEEQMRERREQKQGEEETEE